MITGGKRGPTRMKRETSGQILSAVFVDYDNIYLSLRRKNEEAAKRFAKDAGSWLAEIESGRLITPTNKLTTDVQRRLVLNRCYGNPVPRRNQSDNSTDMTSFPFVRHHFLRAGFEIVDCPPLTAQLKNSSDIRMVMDVRDYLHHDTYFDEFVILSGDADFTPVLHRLRAHARRTVVFANDFTAAPYVAIADGEIRESDLLNMLLGDKPAENIQTNAVAITTTNRAPADDVRQEIIAEISSAVKAAGTPVPLEALAERATRTLGHDRTVGTNWAGAGSFRELLLQSLPEGIRLSEQPPYVAYDVKRQVPNDLPQMPARGERLDRPQAPPTAPRPSIPVAGAGASAARGQALEPAASALKRALPPQRPSQALTPGLPAAPRRETNLEAAQKSPAPQRASTPPAPPKGAENAAALQQSIARIHEACQAPPLSPPEYRTLFEAMAQEINQSGLQGSQTLANIASRGHESGYEFRRDDIHFVLDVVGEADPWFEQGASANLFAGRFRNFVVARCRSHGLNLTADESDLIDAWFIGAPAPAAQRTAPQTAVAPSARTATQPPPTPAAEQRGGQRWWSLDERPASTEVRAAPPRGAIGQPLGPTSFAAGTEDVIGDDEFPRIVRTRLRG